MMPERAFGLGRFGIVSATGELEMVKSLLTSLGFAGLVAVAGVQGAAAAPTAPAIFDAVGPHGQLVEKIYYYHGRHYPYRYNNRYYSHRVYRHNHWHYY